MTHTAASGVTHRETYAPFFPVVAMLFPALAGIAMHANGRSVTGPFVFGDEAQYFAYAHDMFLGASLSGHTHYGLLYPAIMSLLFHFGTIGDVYDGMRIFNVVVLVSSAIPAFLLARMLFPNSAPVQLLFPAFAAIAPVSGLVYVIWADPLFYTVGHWAAFTLFRFWRDPEFAKGVLAGIFVGMLFPLKSGAGLVVAASAFASIAARLAMLPPERRRRALVPVAAFSLVCAALVVPFIIRNLVLKVGLIGYGSAASLLGPRLAELGILRIAAEFAFCLLYQLAYVFVGTFGLLGALVVMPISRWSTLTAELRALVIFTLAWIAGVVALSVVGMTSYGGITYLGYWMPNGRYLGVTFPLAILVAVRLLTLDPVPDRREKLYLCVVTVALATVTSIATPLLVLAPYSFVNNPDLAWAIWVADKGKVVWRALYEPSRFQVVGFAAIFGMFGIMAALLSFRHRLIYMGLFVALMGSTATSIAEHRFVRILGEDQSGHNDAMRFLSERLSGNLSSEVAFDRKMEGGRIAFVRRVWAHRQGDLLFLTETDLAGRINTRGGPRFFVSPDVLAMPVVLKTNGLFVYAVPQP